VKRIALSALALTLFVAGCGPSVPSGTPAITGTIALVTPSGTGGAGAILVEGSGTVGDKASLSVDGTTPVLRQAKDGSITSASFADLKVGMRVSAWVDGPVAESYPVQGAASTIVILE
jgi:hypothetical protein